MDHVRSFFNDLGWFDEEDNNNTDSDKSSIDTKSIDIEEGAEVVAYDPTVDSKSPSYCLESLSPSNVRGSSRRGILFARNSSARSVKSNVSRSIRKVTNSMVEEDDTNDDMDDNGRKYDDPCDEVSDLQRGQARSFTRFRLRSRSNIETVRFPSTSSSDRKFETSIKDIVSCKTVIPDDSALDETPANLFGYACGVEFCTSMELMHKIQGIDGDEDDEDSILDQNANDDAERAPTPMKKKRSFLWRNKSTGMESAKNVNAPVDAKTVTTEETMNSNSSSVPTKKHLRQWGHSKFWTILALLFALVGCVCAVLARQSLNFVTLGRPLIITELYEPINHMGMIRVQICTNASAVASIASLTKTENGSITSESRVESSECTITRFTREEVNDRLFNLSRSLLTMGTYLGIVLTLVLSTSIVWETINLRPIAFGYLVAYFLQSFSMLFFDTDICRDYKCQMATGAYLLITASVCWISALIFVVRMDLFKLQSIRLRRREERKGKREARRQKRKAMALRTQQHREKRMIVDNFQRDSTESFDVLDIEAILATEPTFQRDVDEDMKVMAL